MEAAKLCAVMRGILKLNRIWSNKFTLLSIQILAVGCDSGWIVFDSSLSLNICFLLFQRNPTIDTHTDDSCVVSRGVYSSLFLLISLHVQILLLCWNWIHNVIRKVSQRNQNERAISLFSFMKKMHISSLSLILGQQNKMHNFVMWICYNWLIWVIYTRIPS